jgi:hypothetical protein
MWTLTNFLENVCMSRVSSIGQISMNRLFKVIYESLRIRILTANKIKMSRAA